MRLQYKARIKSEQHKLKLKYMSLFSESDFSKPIDEKLSACLRRNTGKEDRADISNSTNVGLSSLQNTVFRQSNLTVNNSRAVEALAFRAIENCEKCISQAKEDKRQLETLLKQQA